MTHEWRRIVGHTSGKPPTAATSFSDDGPVDELHAHSQHCTRNRGNCHGHFVTTAVSFATTSRDKMNIEPPSRDGGDATRNADERMEDNTSEKRGGPELRTVPLAVKDWSQARLCRRSVTSGRLVGGVARQLERAGTRELCLRFLPQRVVYALPTLFYAILTFSTSGCFTLHFTLRLLYIREWNTHGSINSHLQ